MDNQNEKRNLTNDTQFKYKHKSISLNNEEYEKIKKELNIKTIKENKND